MRSRNKFSKNSSDKKETEHGAVNVPKAKTDNDYSRSVSPMVVAMSNEWAKDKYSNKREIFPMVTNEGHQHNFTYLGYTRFYPNCSSTCGYGSDDWFYLCEESNVYYLLIFSDCASGGTGWMGTELLNGDYEKLTKEDVYFWSSIAFSGERAKIFSIHLTDVERVRHLLPKSSRCGKLTDESYLR